jgi:hypothetical protein
MIVSWFIYISIFIAWSLIRLSRIKFANLICQWYQGRMEYGNVLGIYFQHDPKVSFPSSQQAQKCVTRLLLGYIYTDTHTHTPIPTHRFIYQLLLASVTKNILVAHRLNSRLSQSLFLFVHVAHVANVHCGKWPIFCDLWKWRHVRLAYQQIVKAHMSNFFGL